MIVDKSMSQGNEKLVVYFARKKKIVGILTQGYKNLHVYLS